MKLFAVLLLSVPAFSSVIYDVRGGNTMGFSVSAPDFLPVLDPDKRSWSFTPAELTYYDCGAMGNSTCDGVYLNRSEAGTTAIMRLNIGSQSYSTIEAFFPQVDLSSVGNWTASNGSGRLAISQADAPTTFTPEPSSWMLAALGIGLIGVKGARRLFHRTVDTEVVVSLTR
jgi:hypothetical protein